MGMSRRDFMKSAGGVALGATFANWVAANPAMAKSMDGYFKNERLPGHAQMNLKVALLMTQMAAQSDQGVVQGWNDWLKRKGYDTQWEAPLQDGESDAAKVAAQIEDAVTWKVDAIVVGFGYMESMEGALKAVADAGIPLFTVDSGYKKPSICDIASNNYLMGAQTSEYMIQRLLGQGMSEGNICRVTANFHHGTRKRGKVLTPVLSENEGIKVLDERVIPPQGWFEMTLNATADWMTQHGDKVNAIWCPWDEPAMAACQAILASGRTVKECFVVGHDGHIPAVERMRDEADYPLVATTSHSFPLWGNMVAYYVEQVVGLKRPIKEVVPVPIINMPTPLLVKGFNAPPKDMPTWQFEDMYQTFLKQALGETSG